MALPRNIEEQARKADELMKAQGKTGQPTPEAGKEPAEAKAPEPPKAEKPAEPQQTPPSPSPAIPDAAPKDWEQKYRVLQGKYNAEIGRATQEARQVRDENGTLKSQLQDLQRQVEELKANKPAAAASEGVTPEEVAQYGEDFVEFVRRLARGERPEPPKFDNSVIENRLRPVEEVTMRVARNDFFSRLTPLAPEWESLNTNPEFLGWLAEYDPLTGVQRQSLFDDAYSSLDVERVAAFFNAFAGKATGEGAARPHLPSFDEQVVPRSNAGTPPNPPTKRVWKQTDINTFYDNVRRGRVSAEEAAKIEQDIFAAQRENRIRA